MSILEISDATERGSLAFDLVDILDLFGQDCQFQKWRIESLEAVAKPLSELNVLNLEHRINESEGGLLIGWQELREIAKTIYQTNNCKIVSVSGISIEAQDSTCWVVSCLTPELTARIRARFKMVREVKE